MGQGYTNIYIHTYIYIYIGAVVVYGTGIDILAAVGGLIKNNVPPTLISLVIPGTELEVYIYLFA
jgi:hypothetical protein